MGSTIVDILTNASISYIVTKFSISNMSKLGDSSAEITAAVTADLVFGFGSVLISAAIGRALTQNSKCLQKNKLG